MPSQVSSAGPSPEPPGFRWSWLVLAGTILAGCALGGAVMGVANVSGNGEPGTQARPTVAAADPGAGVEGDAAAVMRPAKPVSTSASPSPACRPLRTRGRSSSTWTAWWRPSLISSPSGCDRPSTTCSRSGTRSRTRRTGVEPWQRSGCRTPRRRRVRTLRRRRRPRDGSRSPQCASVGRRRGHVVRAVAGRGGLDRLRVVAVGRSGWRGRRNGTGPGVRWPRTAGPEQHPPRRRAHASAGRSGRGQLRRHRGRGPWAQGSLRRLAVLLGLTVSLLPSVPAVLLLAGSRRRQSHAPGG